MGNSPAGPEDAPPRNTVPDNKTRICVAGFSASIHFNRARNIAHELATSTPDQYETWFYGPSRDKYFEWLPTYKTEPGVGEEWQKHLTSPICWLERTGGAIEVIGGRDMLVEWVKKTHPDSSASKLADGFLYDPVEYFSEPPKASST